MIDFLTKSIDFIFSVIQTPFVFVYVGLALLICAISIIKVIVWGKRND